MARRIPLPRLTRRQRLARWQRDRRQRLIYLVGFMAVLFFALGLVAWSAATRYYDENLSPALKVGDRTVPMREYSRRLAFERVRFFAQAGIAEEQESHPQLAQFLRQLRRGALDSLVTEHVLVEVAREDAALPPSAEVRARVDRDFGELRVRHVLVKVDEKATDKQKADADAKAKAQALAQQLRADPLNEQLWRDVAAKESQDDGTKERGGDLGWVNTGSGFVKEFEDAMYSLADGQISDPVKSSFGYHVMQRIESRPATRTPFFARLRRSGVGVEELQAVARAAMLRDLYEKRAKEAVIPSPQEQVRLGVIRIRTGSPLQQDTYLAAIAKIQKVIDALDKGEDLAAVAKRESEDLDTKDRGGELGWVTRSMLLDEVANDVFAREADERSQQHQTTPTEISIFKVLEKAGSREVTEEQKTKIRDGAFTRWFREQEQRLGVERYLLEL